MELGSRIKEHRAQLKLSQDELAGRIYVSRQTISSWENDKTYPDVQSLLFLAGVFGTTIDELVRGDVDTMKETVERDMQLLKRLSCAMLGFIALMVLACVWWTYQMTVWDLSVMQTLPTVALAAVLWGIALFASVWADRIKKEHDLVTYQEVLAFWNGRPVDRDTERGRRERLIPRWMKVDEGRAHRRLGAHWRRGGMVLRLRCQLAHGDAHQIARPQQANADEKNMRVLDGS